MAKGRRGGNNRRRVEKREKDSEDSDEEYKVTEDEEYNESDECYSFDGEESEEDNLDDFEVSRRGFRSRNTRRANVTVKSRKKRRIVYKEDDDDDEEEEEVGDVAFVSSVRKVNEVKKPIEKNMVLYNNEEEEEEEEEDEYAEFVSLGSKRNRRTNGREKKRVVYTDDDDEEEKDDDEEDADLCKKRNHIKHPQERKRVVYTDDDDEEEKDDDEEDTDLCKKRNHRKHPQERKRVVYTDDDDRDGVGFVCPRRKRNPRKNPREKKNVVYTEDDEENKGGEEFMSLGSTGNHRESVLEKNIVCAENDDAEFISLGSNRNHRTNPQEKQRVVHTEDDDDDATEFISSGSMRNHSKNLPEKSIVYSEDEEEEEEEDANEDEDKKDAEFRLSESDYVDDEWRCSVSDHVNDEDDSEVVATSMNGNQIEEPVRVTQMVSDKDDYQEDEEDEKDTEFRLSESDYVDDEYRFSVSDYVDDEDETPVMKKNEKISKSYPQKKNVRRGRKKSKKSKIKKPTKSKQRFGQKLEKKQAGYDSDFVSSASSDHEYTLSEEEREQIREAGVYCPNLRPKLRSFSNGIQEEQPAHEPRKYPKRKGKEKVEDTKKDEVGKQVCGICLSEEAKRTVRGVLNCCRHYFCFSCIMEWSKVESRCPLCKQRFATITKDAKSDSGFDLRTVVITVPECDQVYQPSEEELRGYLDPYESVMCTECHNGGDDALMLLCDICDSSAHTFCVGLGREVPEGNWYCEGCRPTVFGTLSSQHPTDRRLSGNASDLSSSPVPGGFDLNEMYVPETPLTQQTQTRVLLPEPPSLTGNAATTLRDRRRLHRHIQDRLFLNNNRMSDLVGRSNGTSANASSSGIRLFGSQLDQTRVPTPQNDHNIMHYSMHDTGIFTPRMDQFGSQLQSSNLATMDPCTSPYACRDVIGPSRTSQGGLQAP